MPRSIWYTLKQIKTQLVRFLVLLLALSGCSILRGIVEGIFLSRVLLQHNADCARLLVENTVTTRIFRWLLVSGGPDLLRDITGPYYIKHIQHPINWVEDMYMMRPTGWKPAGVQDLASLSDLYRYGFEGGEWHEWVYVSAQSSPMNGEEEVDEWDQAFEELLRYRDTHEYFGRADFSYVTCAESFLCEVWKVKGPALLHFTTEEPLQSRPPPATRAAPRYSPRLFPITVRLFKLPLRRPVIPGVFPSPFEQMRSISSIPLFWARQQPYSEKHISFYQALEIFDGISKRHPYTYGLLIKIHRFWHEFLDMFGIGDLPAYEIVRIESLFMTTGVIKAAMVVWFALPHAFRDRVWSRYPELVKQPVGLSPAARLLRIYHDNLSEEQKECFMLSPQGASTLQKLQEGVDDVSGDIWNNVARDIEAAVGR